MHSILHDHIDNLFMKMAWRIGGRETLLTEEVPWKPSTCAQHVLKPVLNVVQAESTVHK